jgi:hypothetical protein
MRLAGIIVGYEFGRISSGITRGIGRGLIRGGEGRREELKQPCYHLLFGLVSTILIHMPYLPPHVCDRWASPPRIQYFEPNSDVTITWEDRR